MLGRCVRMLSTPAAGPGPQVPADLAMPTRAPVLRRAIAATVDGCFSLFCGTVVGTVAQAVGGVGVAESWWAALATASVVFAFRDGLGGSGTRSWGKALAGLEVVLWDGQVAPREACLLRNVPVLVFVAAPSVELVRELILLALVFDLGSMAATEQGKRIGDYALGTRVVLERPGRAVRLLDLREQERMEELEAEMSTLAPDLLPRLYSAKGMQSYNPMSVDVLAAGGLVAVPTSAAQAVAQARVIEVARTSGDALPSDQRAALDARVGRLPFPGEVHDVRGPIAEKARALQRDSQNRAQ
jgi:hypothetical protein